MKTKTLLALFSAITLIGCSTDYQPWQGLHEGGWQIS